MKLRIEDDTLRLRLSDAEVQEFAATGRVAAAVHFGATADQRLTYALERTVPADGPGSVVRVRYAPGALTVLVPEALADAWTGTDQNGFSERVALADARQLRILVEKDLDCRH
ncbi:DUF7009 family protein [Hymenobacter coccineus]|uniref:Uncharacterized protein n=1 Tax=Hymenobacter coccineus TaxID=1908235 RepID=A0A1G1SQ95_9BACT|nr:hypothetical protein [Hymenobacter coccineus]OGX80784.1 hypothetical protein BEN49_03490 [Hymenobacter coccineus]